jgi:hypothetical protein
MKAAGRVRLGNEQDGLVGSGENEDLDGEDQDLFPSAQVLALVCAR